MKYVLIFLIKIYYLFSLRRWRQIRPLLEDLDIQIVSWSTIFSFNFYSNAPQNLDCFFCSWAIILIFPILRFFAKETTKPIISSLRNKFWYTSTFDFKSNLSFIWNFYTFFSYFNTNYSLSLQLVSTIFRVIKKSIHVSIPYD